MIEMHVMRSLLILSLFLHSALSLPYRFNPLDCFNPSPSPPPPPPKLLSLGTSPKDWFEISFTIFLELKVYVAIQIKLGFVTITLFKMEWVFKKPILGPLLQRPSPPADVAKVDAQSGQLSLQSDLGSLTCAGKGGSFGLEGAIDLLPEATS